MDVRDLIAILTDYVNGGVGHYRVWSNDGWGISDPVSEGTIYLDEDSERLWIQS